MSKKLGQIELTLEELQTIVDMTLSKDPTYTRKEIARKIGRSNDTVWKYQKYFGLI